MRKSGWLWSMVFSMLMVVAVAARADMTIDMVGGGSGRYPIAIVPFQNESTALNIPVTRVISNDLTISGAFRVLNLAGVTDRPVTPAAIQYPAWLGIGAKFVVVGTVLPSATPGKQTLSFSLVDAAQKTRLAAANFEVSPDQARQAGHKIADIIYQAITGQPGIFSTKIAYVLKQGSHYALQISDMDGSGPQTILHSKEPVMSPAWSPNGKELAYVSFETQKPVVWVQDLSTGKRRMLANYKGSNSAPAWSPDGRKLLVVLTLTGNSEVYVMSANGGEPQRLTFSQSIDTEPYWSPDGATIYFVSDRSGGPQIYRMPATGGTATRVTWQGGYNVSPRLSPDGKTMVYIQREAGAFRVMLQELGSGDVRQLSSDPFNERPTFAPNGQMVLYASARGGKSVLFASTIDDNSKARLAVINGEVQDPAWGPFN